MWWFWHQTGIWQCDDSGTKRPYGSVMVLALNGHMAMWWFWHQTAIWQCDGSGTKGPYVSVMVLAPNGHMAVRWFWHQTAIWQCDGSGTKRPYGSVMVLAPNGYMAVWWFWHQTVIWQCDGFGTKRPYGRSRRPRGLKRVSTADRLLGLRVRIPPGAWSSVFLSRILCVVRSSDRSLVQRSPTECCASECVCKASTVKRPWPTGGCCVMRGGGRPSATEATLTYTIVIVRLC